MLQELERLGTCPSCRRRIEEDYLLCPYCRTSLRKPCAQCGRALSFGWVACPYCGTDRVPSTAAEAARSQTQAASAAGGPTLRSISAPPPRAEGRAARLPDGQASRPTPNPYPDQTIASVVVGASAPGGLRPYISRPSSVCRDSF